MKLQVIKCNFLSMESMENFPYNDSPNVLTKFVNKNKYFLDILSIKLKQLICHDLIV
jgi:hypothetical protein